MWVYIMRCTVYVLFGFSVSIPAQVSAIDYLFWDGDTPQSATDVLFTKRTPSHSFLTHAPLKSGVITKLNIRVKHLSSDSTVEWTTQLSDPLNHESFCTLLKPHDLAPPRLLRLGTDLAQPGQHVLKAEKIEYESELTKFAFEMWGLLGNWGLLSPQIQRLKIEGDTYTIRRPSSLLTVSQKRPLEQRTFNEGRARTHCFDIGYTESGARVGWAFHFNHHVFQGIFFFQENQGKIEYIANYLLKEMIYKDSSGRSQTFKTLCNAWTAPAPVWAEVVHESSFPFKEHLERLYHTEPDLKPLVFYVNRNGVPVMYFYPTPATKPPSLEESGSPHDTAMTVID